MTVEECMLSVIRLFGILDICLFPFVCKGVYIAVKDPEGYKLSTYLSLEHFRHFRVFEILEVKSDVKTLLEALAFAFNDCKHEVMIAANVDT